MPPVRRPRLFDDPADHLTEIPSVAVHLELTVRAGAFREDRSHVVDGVTAPELVDDVLDEIEQLDREVAHRDLLAAPEVDQPAVDAVTGGPPLVLLDKGAG